MRLKFEARAALIAASDDWLALEERITNGVTWCAKRPCDMRAMKLLSDLRAQEPQLEQAYYAANATMKAVEDA